jgi:hypothetical protein
MLVLKPTSPHNNPNTSMKFTRLIGLIVCAALTGCASSGNKQQMAKPIALSPTLIGQSYDYTSPENISNQDQPVYVLPVKNTGWQKGGVGQDGSWYSGQYRSYIVKPGYWSSQEGAQMSGRPYLVNNQTVIPSPAPDGAPGTNPGPEELDISKTNSRLDALEQGQAKTQTQTGNPDNQAAAAAREQALAVLANPQIKTEVDATTDGSDSEEVKPQISVPSTPLHHKKRAQMEAEQPTPSSPPPGAKMARIHYDTQTTGSVIMDGRSYPFTLKHPGDTVTLQVPVNQP